MRKLVIFLSILTVLYSSAYSAESSRSFFEGYNLMQKGMYSQAVSKFREAIKESPEYAPTYTNLAKCHEFLKQYSDAIPILRKAARLIPRDTKKIQRHIVLLGEMKQVLPYISKGDIKSAMPVLGRVIRDPYKNSFIRLDALCYLSHYFYTINSYDNAQQMAETAIKSYSLNFIPAQTLYEYADVLKSHGKNYVQAVKIYISLGQKANSPYSKVDLENLVAECYLGIAKESKDEKVKKAMYERIVIQCPNSRYAAEARKKVGDIIEKVKRLKEDADVQFDIGSYAAALPIYRKIYTDYGNTDTAQYAMYCVGKCLANSGKYKSAVKQFHELVRKYPKGEYADDALMGAGCLLSGLMKQLDLALKEWAYFLAHYPKSEYADDAYFDIGRIYTAKKNYKKAYQAYVYLLKKYPDSPWIRLVREEMLKIKRGEYK